MHKLLLLFCLLANISFAQKMPDYGINKIHIYLEDKSLLFETIPLKSHPDIVPAKTYYWYGSNTVHQTQGGFSGKLLNGSYKEYYLDKNLKEEGIYKAGLKDGVWKTWTTDGKLVSSLTWSNGVKSGPFALYDETGKLAQSGNYNVGLFNGPITFHTGPDSIRVVRYENGKVAPARRPFLKRINIFKRNQKDSLVKQP